jgi:hypothetical protein
MTVAWQGDPPDWHPGEAVARQLIEEKRWREARLDIDREAWNRAVIELPTATLSTVLQRAQTIKEEICSIIKV